jgi:hypothetical protein
MKKLLQFFKAGCLLWAFLFGLSGFGQTYNLLQNFDLGGSGSDGCWTGYNQSTTPTYNNFFTTNSPVQSGAYSGGMYSCCGGISTNTPAYYISPKLIAGTHNVSVYLRQSSSFNEDFEIGTVSDSIGSNFTAAYTKSVWPSPAAWQLTTTSVVTNASNKRIAFRVPPASLKTYYLDSILISNTGNGTAACSYILITGIDDAKTNQLLWDIYPNPASDMLHITGTSSENFEIEIINTLGEICLTAKNQNTFNLSQLQNGIYFIKGFDNSSTAVKKIIIRR